MKIKKQLSQPATRNTQHFKKCRTCKKHKDIATGFYKYDNGKPYADCIECTRSRANANYNNRPKQVGMTDEDIEAYLKAHPIPREEIRQRRRRHYAD